MEHTKEIYLAGGCFWGTERFLQNLYGVTKTKSGYANGNTENPTYEEVCRGSAGHAEAVQAVYRPEILSLSFLLDLYYATIDPLSMNRQGSDRGLQYRTGIYYTDANDRAVIEISLRCLQKAYSEPLAIEVQPLKHFFPAESYHQNYLRNNPGGYCHIRPTLLQKAKQIRVDPYQYVCPAQNELKKILSSEEYAVTQENATEPPFQNQYWNHLKRGIYVDITTGEPLFSSADQFQCSCGWPSFTQPIDPYVAKETEDASLGMLRIEVRSRVGNTHLGHVFDDGPLEKGGKRYCINSAALHFIPAEAMEGTSCDYLLPYL